MKLPSGWTIVAVAILAIVVLPLIAAVGIVGYVIYFYVFQGLFSPVRKARAKAVRKYQREWELDAPRYIGGPAVGSILFNRIMTGLGRDVTVTVYRTNDYFVVFQFDGGEQEFAVSEETYTNIHEGDEGVLYYKGHLFKSFLPLRPSTTETV